VTIKLHNLMPLVIGTADYDRWLSADPPPVDLLKPYKARKMAAPEIGTKTGDDVPDILDPAPPARDEGPARPELPL
jgi:putative SOS response-associated peptidase YedK